jgi:hypothetical protein
MIIQDHLSAQNETTDISKSLPNKQFIFDGRAKRPGKNVDASRRFAFARMMNILLDKANQLKRKENIMNDINACKPKIIMDLEALNATNAQGCVACGRKFNLGDTAVLACGAWGDGSRYIHENEAVQDNQTSQYFERGYYMSLKAGT